MTQRTVAIGAALALVLVSAAPVAGSFMTGNELKKYCQGEAAFERGMCLGFSSAVVTWEGAGQPIVLTAHGPAGEVMVPLTPVRALELAKELTEPAVTVIKTSQWGPGWPG